jgi:hypothetical protein
MKTLTFEEFEEKYKPQENLIIKENTYLYEIFGEELEYVKKQHNNFIWTLIDTDDEEQWIIPGYHIINRSSYLITEIPWENENIQVNDNEMITRENAIKACISFFKKLRFSISSIALFNLSLLFFEDKRYIVSCIELYSS